jgi:FAD/FMN-containing dehydrogenase
MSSHKYGLATDWIVGMTVVLANGTIAHTSATENPGLFWALRGSGSNYGVVASYEFNTFAAPSQVTYFSMPAKWNTTTAPGYMNAVENYTKAVMPADLTMRMFASSYQHYFEGMFFGDVAGLKAALKPLQDKIPGLAIQSAVNTTWLKAFEHYANAATDPTTPYKMVRMSDSGSGFVCHILTQHLHSKKISTPKASPSKASTAPR